MVTGAGVVAAVHVGKGAIFGPQLQTTFAVDLAALAWVTAIFAVIGVFGGIPAGALVAPVGDRRVLLSGLGVLAIGAALGAVAQSFSMILMSRIIEGAGFLLVIVAGPAILGRLVSGARRDIVLALWSCFMPTGMALALVIGPMIVDWRLAWWASGGISALFFLGVILSVAGQSAGATGVAWRTVAGDAWATLSNRGALLLAAIFALYSLMFFALFSFLPVLLMDRLDVSLATAGALGAAVTGINVAGNLTAGIMLGRGISRVVLLAGTSLAMGIAALGIFLPVLPDMTAFLLCLVFSALGGLLPATVLATSPVVVTTARQMPIAIGLIMQGSNLGQVVGPVAIGGVFMAFGWSAGAAVVGVAAICAVGLTMLLSRALPAGR
ncbi:putative MFS family arabinose efflux permease [Dongia mobilis]|uniref:Putative MFS family arabinose efflux permease n=1 Tax=Dongia mobilis TaxID=578943 RepID=A0A4R6WL39_9PROT|nr:MFS transporter [Dongia mobilis]TDQ78553.1 putative MFS family arabinose efflux permease [Dongia mobilis]